MEINISPDMLANLAALEAELKAQGKRLAPVRMGTKGGVLGPKPRPDEEFIRYLYSRFEVSPTGCWEWQGHKRERGYGVVRYQSHQIAVARAMFWIHNGPMAPKMCVCHKCNNPPCSRPDHLYAATHLQNMRDAYRDGLIPVRRGEQIGRSKFTSTQVLELRNRLASGTRLATLLKENGMGARAAIIGQTWKHVPMPFALAQRYPSNL